MAEQIDTDYRASNGAVIFQLYVDDQTDRLTRVVYQNLTPARAYALLHNPSDNTQTDRTYLLPADTPITITYPPGSQGPKMTGHYVEAGWPADESTQQSPGKRP
jgi:hypothetical protein